MARNKGAKSRTVEEYLKLPYTIRVSPDPTGGYVADVAELPGCSTQGETWEEVGEMVCDAIRGWIELRLEDGLPVPEPVGAAPPAKMLVRLPRSLHQDLVRAAEREGVSLNQFAIYQLALAVGWTTRETDVPAYRRQVGV
jgi:antitoxin HicB